MDTREIVNYVETIIGDLTGASGLITEDDNVEEEIVIVPEEEKPDEKYNEAGTDESTEDDDQSEKELPGDPEYIPTTTDELTGVTNQIKVESDPVIFREEDKEQLDYLYGLFSNMDETQLKALASDMENASIGNTSIDLSDPEVQESFISCIDDMAIDQDSIDEDYNTVMSSIDHALSLGGDVFLIPINKDEIKRKLIGAFSDDLTEEELAQLESAVDSAVSTVDVFNENTLPQVFNSFLNSTQSILDDEEKQETASSIFESSVHQHETEEEALTQAIKDDLVFSLSDSAAVAFTDSSVQSLVNGVINAKGVDDISKDFEEWVESNSYEENDSELLKTAYRSIAPLVLSSDNLTETVASFGEAVNNKRNEFSSAFVADVLDGDKLQELYDIISDGDFSFSLDVAKRQVASDVVEAIAAKKIDAETIETVKLIFKTAVGDHLDLRTLNAKLGKFETIVADTISAEQLTAAKATIREATIDTLYVNTLNAKLAIIQQAIIDTLDAKIANINVANIDFANINLVQVEKIFSKAGVISDLTTETGTITGELVGVTISGDLIEANTLKADKLVVLGSDGLYYKLNVSGETVESQQTDYNSINGSNIQAKTITASKINVTDLVAFGAKIGGLTIENGGIHSDGKTIDNGQAGIYMDSQGQFNTGDGQSFIKSYYDETDQKWKVKIQSDLLYLSTGRSISSAVDKVDEMNQHFWYDSEGAHVSGSGYQTDINARGMEIISKYDNTSIASFGEDGARLGRAYNPTAGYNESNVNIDYHSLRFTDKEGRDYLFISDLRNRDGEAILKEHITVQPNQSEIDTSMGVDRVVSAKNYETDEDLTSACAAYEVGTAKVWLSRTFSTEFTLELEYATSSTKAKAFTFGSRDELSAIGLTSTAFGDHVVASGILSFAEGASSVASGKVSHAEGNGTIASGENSHAEGEYTTASGYNSHAEGFNTEATEMYSHAEGISTKATNNAAHAEGAISTAEGYYSHAEGEYTTASGQASHAEGENTKAGDLATHVEGYYSAAYGIGSHAEGYSTKALENYTHAEGYGTIARGHAAHAEGYNTKTEGYYSHAQNNGTIAKRASQTAIGEYNIEDSGGTSVSERGNYAVIVGNGTSKDARSNALTVDWNGNVNASGNVNATDVTASGSVNAATSVNVGGTNILELVYPVGSIYMSVNATDPGTLFGGTWTRIEDRFLLAAGSTYAAGGTGGAATVKLTDAQIAHGHGFTQPSVTGGSHNHGIITRLNTGTATGYPIELSGSAKQGVGKHTENDGGHKHTVSGGAVANLSGASSTRTAHQNMPPYLTVYMWKRTA